MKTLFMARWSVVNPQLQITPHTIPKKTILPFFKAQTTIPSSLQCEKIHKG
jgi:hypothetical protein